MGFGVLNILPEFLLSVAILYIAVYGSILGYNGIRDLPLLCLSVCYVYVLVIFGCCLLLFLEFFDFLWYGLILISGSFKSDNLAIFSKVLVGVASIIFILNITLYLKFSKINHFEYPLIILFSLLGIYLLCSSNDLLFSYLAIEIQSLAFYIMSSFKRSSGYSIDSGLKYFVLGSLSSILFLFGTSMIYGLSGAIQFNVFGDLFSWDFASKNSILFAVGKGDISFTLDKLLYESVTLDLDSEIQLNRILDKFVILGAAVTIGDLDLNILTNIINTEFFSFRNRWSDKLNDLIESGFDISETLIAKTMYSRLTLVLSNQDREESMSTISYWSKKAPQGGHIKKTIWEYYNNNVMGHAHLVFFDNYLHRMNMLSDIPDSPAKEELLAEYAAGRTTVDLMGWTWFRNNGIRKELVWENILGEHTHKNVTFISEFYEELVSWPTQWEVEHYVLINMTRVLVHITCFYEPYKNYLSYAQCFWRTVEPALILVLAGIFLKLAVAPFHSWAIDVYEGAPSSSSFFFAVISKLGIFILLIRLCYSSFYSYTTNWQTYCLILAVLSIFVGSIAGLEQRKLKSLLAFSSVSHGGYSILALSSGNFEGIQMVLNYLFIYTVSGLCVWSVILLLNNKFQENIKNKTLSDLILLIKSNSIFSFVLLFGLFSLAGIPPTAGFLAKVGVILVVVGSGFYLYALLAVLSSMFSTFYYIRLVKISNFENKLIGKLYLPIKSGSSTDLLGFLSLLILLMFISPAVLFFWSYKTTLLFS